jgi:hypothetical protein
MDNNQYKKGEFSEDPEKNEEFYTALFWLLTLPPEELGDKLFSVYKRTQLYGDKPVELMDAWANECREEVEDFISWNRKMTGGPSFV